MSLINNCLAIKIKMTTTVSYKAIEARKFVSGAFKQTAQIVSKSTLTHLIRTENGLCIGFVFISNYEPNVGFIRIEGEINIATNPEEANKALKEWETSENRRLPQEMAETIHNSIISNCMIETAVISREINLPPPFPIPHIQLGKDQAQPVETVNREVTKYIQ